MRRRRRSAMREAVPSVSRYESTASTTGIAVPCSAAAATARRIMPCEASGRTPSCTAINSGSRFRAFSPFFTEWNRSSPPVVTVCAAMSKRAAKSFQKSACSAGSTTTIFCPGQRPGEIVDRMGQDGQAAQHHELLGTRTSHAGSAPACYDDDSYLLFHISFFPNPSVLSVNFIKSGAIAHRVSSASTA